MVRSIDGHGRGVEAVDPVIFNELPNPVRLRPVRCAFIHERSGAIRQRAVDDIAMSGYPADISGAPVNVLFPQVEDIFGCRINPNQVTPGRMQNALRFSSRSTGVKNVERMLAIE